MAPKRKRRISPVPKGLAAGEHLQRNKLSGNESSAWGWVGTEVFDFSQITKEHRMATCGFSKRSRNSFCVNKYALLDRRRTSPCEATKANGELDDDVIVISDDEPPLCSKKLCKNNPNCLNYLGQEKWEDEDEARQSYLKTLNLGENPLLDVREPGVPVGLKNLGATCYANAFLQVWYRDLAFRNGVYQCQPPQNSANKFEDSPVFQLQVTFAALQESTQNVFNPTRLVESLKLRATEQQDAQEFSKLFMSHLDAEFQKQSTPYLKSLIADQFQGKQVYGTICDNCQNRSERPSDFLEIEINFENNAKLNDRISALLQPEKLSGDNKYLCAQCESLQDATRYTELRQLPPVLHFSLLRFVYDISSMERKKSKNTIVFPTTLNMDQFMGSKASRRMAASDKSKGGNIYELRGVLLHKGTSAYHGHYEAQVFDAINKAWFQFDDETVTEIKTLGDKRSRSKTIIDVEEEDDENATGSKGRNKRLKKTAKKLRIDESDDDSVIEIHSPTSTESKDANFCEISSKDAYMLVYTRKNVFSGRNDTSLHEMPPVATTNRNGHGQTIPEVPTPPPRVLSVVSSLNATHEQACEEYLSKESEVKLRFADLRQKVMTVYRSWSVSDAREDSVIVSQQALEEWVDKYLVKPTEDQSTATGISEVVEHSSPQTIVMSDIICMHNRLDPAKAGSMKRISRAVIEKMENNTLTIFSPTLFPEDVCEQCVEVHFRERLYQIEHPQTVAQFDEVNVLEEDSQGYWISKPWLKDWRLAKPKMHITSKADPAPDTSDFSGHVKCEHGGLALNITARRRISTEAYYMLKTLFPSWDTLSTDAEVCAVCDALIHISKGDKREIRRRVEDEKARLKHMHDNALTGGTMDLENVPCAIIPAQFVRFWKQWLSRPTDSPRPETVDNASFMCEHGMLLLDPNSPGDLNTSVAVIKRSDWDVLEELYSGGPLIALEKRLVEEDTEGPLQNKYVHDIPTCVDCRRKRKLDYETTEVTIRILSPRDPNPTPDTYTECSNSVRFTSENTRRLPAVIYGSNKTGATRQSTRIRQVAEKGGRRKLTVSKQSTVKDIKVKLQDELDIPTVYQRLFYRGRELADNADTVASLGILADDLLDLREENEDEKNLTDSDTPQVKKKRREEGRGFGGTLLGGGSSQPSSRSSMEMEIDEVGPSIIPTKSCSACTFANLSDAFACEICDTLLS